MQRKRTRPRHPEVSGIPEDLTGFSGKKRPYVTLPDGKKDRPVSMAWISNELLARTQQVWSRAYGRPVGVEEAVEILTNVKHLAEALMKAKKRR